ncbi:MAG: 5-bromo-4-chloroindolyl phosphate hydrolysis family protein, partial [Eubacteriales bacterium]
TFMNYYLPTTLKLLESYSRIERVGVAGENMKQSKEKIENILDLLAVGFEQQVDQLFKNESIDISSDISVLEKMMQKDGLSGKNDFDISRFDEFTDGYSDEISDELGAFGGTAAQTAPDSADKES